MAQVHNRVNAGVMDGVVYGGMMEAAEPEDDRYRLGVENGGLEPFGHAVNESTDCVRFGEHYYDCYFSNAIAFMSLLRKDGSKGRIFVAPPGNLHGNLKAYLIGNKEINPEEYGRPSELKSDEKRTGRFWFGDGCNIISFYSYPESTKQIYSNCVEALIAIKEKTGEDFNIGEVMVDLWTKSIRNPIIMPVRWFNNGMADTFLPITEKCEPYEYFDGTFRYKVVTKKGTFTVDWRGDDIEEEQGYGSLYESKEHKETPGLKKYIKSLIDFMREQHLRIDPLPSIELNPEEQDGLFIKTGYYSPEESKVVVFTYGRALKDILRTVSHEFIHHMQNLQNPNKDWGTGGDLEADKTLRGIEGEAFLLGNIIFREWTEKMKKTGELNESINHKKALVDLKNRRDPDGIGDWNRLDENEGTNIKKARNYLKSKGYNEEQRQEILNKIRQEIPNVKLGNCKFMLGVTRLYLEGELKGPAGKNLISKILNVITSEPFIDTYDYNLNGKCLSALWMEYRSNPEIVNHRILNTIQAKRVKTPNGYTIIPILSQEDASKFTDYVNWCIVNSGAFDAYAWGGGMFFFCLKDGFQNIYDFDGKSDRNNEPPLDVYGTSMIAVRIDPTGKISSITSRWNHKARCISSKELDLIIGIPFSEVMEKAGITFNGWSEDMDDNSGVGAIFEDVEPDDVDLSSFNIKKHLNPKFWDDGHLDTRIRLKLLDIADDFFDSLDVDWVEPVDVIITGSIANYNWNKKYSDIDLHILVDYEDVDERVDFVREYFTLKKNAWNEKHKNLRIFGFPVEVYVQDANEPHASSGVYSIDKDKWLTEPDFDKLRSGKVDKRHIREMVSTYMNKIDCLIDIYKKHKDDDYEMKKVAKDASEMFDEIKKMRKDDLAKYGREMCDGNIIFKALRRSDYIGKLIKLKDLTYDKINSL